MQPSHGFLQLSHRLQEVLHLEHLLQEGLHLSLPKEKGLGRFLQSELRLAASPLRSSRCLEASPTAGTDAADPPAGAAAFALGPAPTALRCSRNGAGCWAVRTLGSRSAGAATPLTGAPPALPRLALFSLGGVAAGRAAPGARQRLP